MFKKLLPTLLMLVALNAGAAFVRDNGAAPTVYDDQNDLTWVESASATGGANVIWANAITTCENLIYAGRDDWRLPNFNELVSLADYTRSAPAINPNFQLSFFGASNYYWSGTTDPANTAYARVMTYDKGLSASGLKTDATNYNAICVRNGHLSPQVAPMASNNSYSVTEDAVLGGNVITDGTPDSDANGDVLLVASWRYKPVTAPAKPNGHGALRLDPSGTFTYTPFKDYNGTDVFEYTIVDSRGGSSTATVTINVTPVNDPPVAGDDSFSIQEGVALTGQNVLTNDTDPDGNPLQVSAWGTPANGSLSATTANGGFVYTPNNFFNGADTFTYSVSDGQGGTAQATVHITVGAVNDAPVITEGASLQVSMDEDAFSPPLVTLHAQDKDKDKLYWRVVTPAAHGSAVVSPKPGSSSPVAYQPNANYNGTDSFQVEVSDPSGATDLITIFVTVRPVNDPPVATDNSYTTLENTPVSGNAITDAPADSDLEGDTLSVSAWGKPGFGDLTADANGSFTYMPYPHFVGTDQFSYTLSDGHGGTATAHVHVTVGNVNDAPVITQGSQVSVVMNQDGSLPFQLSLTAIDKDKDKLSWSILTPASYGTASVTTKTGFVGYIPIAGFSGTDSFVVRVSDGQASDTIVVTVHVLINQAPTAQASLNGTAQVAQMLSGSDVYNDADNNPQDTTASGSSFRFVRSDDALLSTGGDNTVVASGATSGTAQTYTAGAADESKYIFYCVTPKASIGTSPGSESCSGARGPVIPAAINGGCDAASDGHTLTTAPVALCSAGSASVVTSSNSRFDWSCAGSNGGLTKSCSATRHYLVTPVPGLGGNLTPNAQTRVAYGATLSISVVANAGYSLQGVSGCGGTLSGNTYTTGPVTAACSLTPSFTPDSFSITTTASPTQGGSVVCSPNPVTYGNSSTCTAIANAGYSLTSFGGACVGSACILSNVASTLSVTANFVAGTYSVGGTVANLLGSGLLLQLNTGNDLAIGANGSFSFVQKLTTGSTYTVSIKTQPSNPTQTCTVSNGTGTLSGANVNNVTVICATSTYTVGGTVSGLTGSGLVLQVNSANNKTISGNGAFTFANALANGTFYTVSVLTQPSSPSQVCTVINGAGTLSGANVSNVAVNCVAGPTTSVSGTVPGVSGTFTAVLTGGGTTCGFTSSSFGAASSILPTPPTGVTFPLGALAFETSGCSGTITVRITYPQNLPSGTRYWKYGRTPTNRTAHWYVLSTASQTAANQITFTITDGGEGDDDGDLQPNGTIVDPGGPGVGGALDSVTPVPTLSEWGMILLAGLLAMAGLMQLRRSPGYRK